MFSLIMKSLILLISLVVQNLLLAKTICLNMIVKNESRSIQRCLESVKPLIDSWVIVDTGSTDGTQILIQEILKDKPGELYERPWVDFGHNRNEALALAQDRADYLLMIDADEMLAFSSGFSMPLLDKDCYFITVREPRADYQRLFLIDARLPWRWEGVLHESLICDPPHTFDLIEGVMNLSQTNDGGRAQDKQKYAKDALILEEALKKDPANSRYAFYLAQSYCNAGEYLLALETHKKRIGMGGWDEEIFWSLYQIGVLQEVLQMDPKGIIEAYTAAYQYRPSRMEPLYRLANTYLQQRDYVQGYITAKHALSIPLSQDHVFVERWIYSYGVWLTFANCAFELKRYGEAAEACRQVLLQPDLPDEMRERVQSNLDLLTP